jgi:hypothetical protein
MKPMQGLFALFARYSIVLSTLFFLFQDGLADPRDGKGFEIRSHKAALQIFPQQNSLACLDTITIHRVAAGGEKLTLNLLPVFEVSALSVNGKKQEFKRGSDFVLIGDLPSDSVFDVTISYAGELSFRSDVCRISQTNAVLREEIVLPRCEEYLTFARISVTVPKEWEAVTAGSLIAQYTVNDSTTFVWEANEINSEIGWICAGVFKSQKGEGAHPVTVHLFQDDSTTSTKDIISLTDKVLEFYSGKFSPYRYAKLDIIEVEDWVAGRNVLAIAAPSFIMVKKMAFETHDAFNKPATILPHEIAHQWWPLTVFIDDEDAALLSEGMCEYSARLYNEAHHSMTIRDSLDRHPLLRPLIMKVIQGDDIPLQQKADLRTVVTHYLKASYVHNMLRSYIGDSAFARLLREYAVRFNLKKASAKDFQKLAEELSGKKLDWFFTQWVVNKGLPHLKIYNAHAKEEGSFWITRGRLRLVGYDKYTTFVDIGVKTPKGITTDREWIGTSLSQSAGDANAPGEYHNDVPFEIPTREKPSAVLLDPYGNLLKIKKIPPKFGDLRDPGNGVMIVGSLKHAGHLLELARKDSTAMDLGGWSLTIKMDTEVTLSDLQQNHVFLYGNASENSKAGEFQEKFPMKIRNDSVIVGTETIYDTSLTLLQMIENPFSPNGSLCWIAPLSEKANPELLPFDASWILLRNKEEISSGTWDVKDEDLEIQIKNEK